MEPVPWQLKIAFHFFGFGSLILGMVLFASTLASEVCVSIFVSKHKLLFFWMIVKNIHVHVERLKDNNNI